MEKLAPYELQNRISLLKEVKIFSDAGDEILAEIAENLNEQVLEPNETLFHKGDNLHALFIIVNGLVKVHDGDYVFTELHNRNFFGEYSLIDSTSRSASISAIEKTKLLKLDQGIFNKLSDKYPAINKAILRAMIKRLRNNNILEERLTRISKEIERQKDEIDKKRKELEVLNASKDRFFSIIAHDLKNPISTVIGLSDLLMNSVDQFEKEQIKEFSVQLNVFANKSFELLENLLHWSRSQLGAIKPNPREIDLYEIILENTELLRGATMNKKLELTNHVIPGTKAFADQHMVTTIIRNLLNNAIKFTPEKGKISFSTVNFGDYIEVSVTDTGVGIKKELIDKLFYIGTNQSTMGTNQEKGTGLGLVLTKEFVEKNGGEIWIESEPGMGSTFKFTIPAHAPKEKI